MTGLDVHNAMRQAAAGRTLNGADFWRAASFRTTEGAAMTIRRAEALNAVLRNCDLLHTPGELLAGSSLGRWLTPSPQREAQREQDRACLKPLAGRDFLTHADHHAPDYATLLSLGLPGLAAQVSESLGRHTDPHRRVFLQSVRIALEGVVEHLRRWSSHLDSLADSYPEQAQLLREQAAMLGRLAAAPPATFHEAVQLVWFVHTVLQCDERYAMALGRADQYLCPFYQADLQAGRITRERAQMILEHLFGKLTGVGGDIQNVAVGGLTPDGGDATNELSHMILEACRRVGRPGGNVTARIHSGTPRDFLRRCAEVIRTGIGYPALVNDEILVPALVEQGIPVEEARDYCFVGCIETFLPGRMGPWADSRFNLLYCVNLVVFRGIDSLTGRRVGPDTGEPLRGWNSTRPSRPSCAGTCRSTSGGSMTGSARPRNVPAT